MLFAIDIDMLDAMTMQNIEANLNSLPVTMYRIDHIDAESERKISILKAARLLRKFVGPDGKVYKFT